MRDEASDVMSIIVDVMVLDRDGALCSRCYEWFLGGTNIKMLAADGMIDFGLNTYDTIQCLLTRVSYALLIIP